MNCSLRVDGGLLAVVVERNCVSRVASVYLGPPLCGSLCEELVTVGTLLAACDPRSYAVGEVPGMTHMVEGELFGRLVPDLEVVEFVREVPLPPAA